MSRHSLRRSTAHEAVFMDADVDRHGAGIFDRGGPVFFHQGKHSEDAADAGTAVLLVDQLAELTDGGSRMFGATQQLRCAEGHFFRMVFFLDAIAAALLT